MLAPRLTLAALIALAAIGCGKEDRTAPPRTPGGGAGRDAGPMSGTGGGRTDGGTPDDAGQSGCLASGGAGTVTTLEGERVVGTVEGLFTVASIEPTTDGASTTLQFEVVGGDFEIDAGGGDEEYRVELIMTALPRTHVQVGDVLGILWNGGMTEGQASTLIVLRDDALLFFAARALPARMDAESLLPALEPYGITISTGDTTCEAHANSCNFREHALRVKSGAETATVSETGLARAGDLTVAGRVLERLPTDAECFLAETTLLASGFVKRQ